MKEKNLFLASIKERVCLNPGSIKETYHLILDIEGAGIDYAVGDCLGIYPRNDPELVKGLLSSLKATGNEIIEDRQGTTHVIEEFLLQKANILNLPKEEGLTKENFCKHLSPLLPRFYSIASSKAVVGNEAHLTIRLIDGICTQYLCKTAPLGVPLLSVFHHPSRQFALPAESVDKDIIMVGPGTGIAPFRGFMQERIAKDSTGKNWLFFGERHSATDFYYKDYWERLVEEKKLQLDCAFSRDQQERVYVQHKMWEKKAELWHWLDSGAYLFVCGDASKMAKDVDKTLLLIAEQEGKLSPEAAKNYFRELKKAKRYQRDVY